MARARLPPRLLLLALASAVIVVAAATPADVCVGPIVKLSVFAPAGKGDAVDADKQPFSTEYGVLAAFGGLPPNATSPSERKRLRLRLAEPLTACSERNGTTTSGSADFAGAWALAARGGGKNCSFAAKYDRLVHQLGAAGVLVYDDRPGCVVMGAVPPPAPAPPSPDDPSPPPPPPPPPPAPKPDEDQDNAPPALSLDHDRGLALAELVRAVEGAGGVVEVEAWLPELPPALTGGGWGAAASALALAAMATGTVVWGSLWSGSDKLKELQEEEEEEEDATTRRRRQGRRRRQQHYPSEQAASPHNPLEVTPAGALWFVFIASCSLLAIWCLRGPFIAALITAAFAAGGAQGVAAWLSPLLRRVGVAAAGQQQRVPEWAATALELLFGLPPMDDDEALEEQQGGWQALPSSSASAAPQAAATTPDARPPSSVYHYRRADLLAAAIALSTAALWFLADRWAWPAAWLSAPLQDVLAVSLLAQLLRALRLPDFQSACALLPLVLLYDVFWVFLQPRLFGGDSVMVDVATGAGGGAARPLPLLLRVPSPLFGLGAALAEALPGLPASISPGGGDSLLGFGDVVLPGMLAALARRVDVGRRWERQERRQERRDEEEAEGGRAAAAAADCSGPSSSSSSCLSSSPYLVAVSVAYALGLALTFLALKAGVGGEGGQPALLYLCPCVLSAFGGVAWWRGEMKEVWRGEGGIDDEEEEEAEGR